MASRRCAANFENSSNSSLSSRQSKRSKYGVPLGNPMESLDLTPEGTTCVNIPQLDRVSAETLFSSENVVVAKPRLETGTAYASKIRLKAEKDAVAILKGEMDPIVYESIEPTELLDNLTDADTYSQFSEQQAPQPFNGLSGRGNMQFNYKQDSNAMPLPIRDHQKEIIETVRSQRVTVIEGSTGCGKTTQVPLFIAQDCSFRGEKVNIVVTQPRRIAAISVARHVAQLCHSKLGEYVGYQIALDRKHDGPRTNILFCTTGVLLQKIIHSKSLTYYTHIMIDEVHERDVETDFLLMVVRKLMWEQNSNVKLVLMSATFESDRVAEYFTINIDDPTLLPLTKPKIIKLEGAPKRLQIFYLDALSSNTPLPAQELFNKSEAKLVPQLYDLCGTVIDLLDVQEAIKTDTSRGAVLVFLPGLNEINQMKTKLDAKQNASMFQVLLLHSCINDAEQHKVFKKAPPGIRKVILATNIAESSITVPDISYVIDFCLTKQLVVDPISNLPTLKLQWATKANMDQRAGRAGRVRDGRVYRLIRSSFFHSLSQFPIPEICRCPLDLAVLRTKVLDLGQPKELLAFCLDPPNLEKIRTALLKLKRIGGLTVLLSDGSYDHEDGQLTAMGKIMSSLPIDVNLTKLVCLGYAFGLLEDCVNIAACLSVQSIFYYDAGERLNSYKIRFDWSERSFCDHITFRYIMAEFLAFYDDDDQTRENRPSLELWAQFNRVNIRRMIEAKTIRNDILQRLEMIGIVRDEVPDLKLKPNEKDLILKAIIAGAFYPNYFLRNKPDQVHITRSELNPYNSVTLSRLPEEGVIYANQIRTFFSTVSTNIDLRFRDLHVDVIFPQNDSNVSHQSRTFLHSRNRHDMQRFVTSNLRQDDFCKSVYVALMMREFQMPVTLNTITDAKTIKKSMDYFRQKRDGKNTGKLIRSESFFLSSSKPPKIPPHLPIDYKLSSIDVRVTHVEKCGHFWAQVTPQDTERLYKVRDALSHIDLKPIDSQDLHINKPCIYVSYSNVPQLQTRSRAIVQCVSGQNRNTEVFLRLVDSGKSKWTNIKDIFEMDDNTINENCNLQCLHDPAVAIECQLIQIRPLDYFCGGVSHTRSEEANKYFEDLLEKQLNLRLEVYSYVDGVLRVSFSFSATGPDGQASREDASTHLVMKGLAEHSTESCLSQFDHNVRLQEMNRMDDGENRSVTTYYEKPLRGINESFYIKKEQGRELRKLAGPSNPLLISFYGVPKTFRRFPVKIERNSINAVVLEPDSTFEKERMMVASSCNVSNGSRIIANTTSLMPYIRGFPSMMQLLFAPCVELRFDEEHKCYVGALSGLGASPSQASESSSSTYSSYDEDHDIEMVFDAFFTSDDLCSIQSIRSILSYILHDASSSLTRVALNISGPSLNRWRKQLCSLVTSLLSINRVPPPECIKRTVSNRWVAIDPSRLVDPFLGSSTALKNPFLPQILLVQGISPTLTAIKEKLAQLSQAEQVGENVITSCPLCGSRLYNKSTITDHLVSEEHKLRLMQFQIHFSQVAKSTSTQQLQVDDAASENMEA